MRGIKWALLGVIISFSWHVAPTNENTVYAASDIPPDVDIPADGNHYIVPRTSRDVYLRPNTSAPKIGNIHSTRSSPRVVQVYSKEEKRTGGYWWEVRYRDQIGYIHTFDGSTAPYTPTDLPPDIDRLAGYQGTSVLITGIKPSRPDTAGGVDVHIGTLNPNGGEVIKYIRFDVSPYNRVGDKVKGEISNLDHASLRKTGPIEPDGLEDWSKWGNVFYNSIITCMEINKIDVEYMDGSVEAFSGDGLAAIFHQDAANDCGY